MRLSEYRKRLDKIARREKKAGRDPEMVESRWSDTAIIDDKYPKLIHGRPKADEWIEELSDTSVEELRATGVDIKTYVLVSK